MSKEVRQFYENAKRGDVVPEAYPVPQTEVHTARDVGFVADRQSHGYSLGDMSNVIPGEYHEVKPEQAKPSFVARLRDVGGKVWDGATPFFNKGADELVRAMYTGSAYSIHGSTIPEQQPENEPQQQAETQREMKRGRSM